MRNQFTERMQEMNALILDYPVQNSLTGSMRKKAKEIDNIEFMSLWAGQSSTLCRNIAAGELVNLLMREMG
ncbi:nitronate monooxygenase [Legionella dresdenensis]|uniref:Nitronate monooxygenase n=1 Tax=Legionella dresdenensis TaxID=450200 RepID=A0ABV8CFG9_9GAMM